MYLKRTTNLVGFIYHSKPKMWKLFVILYVAAFTKSTAFANYTPSSRCPKIDGPKSVYFPDPDCAKFWQCSNGVAYQHLCPANLHFNPTLNVCDNPADAGCTGEPATNSSERVWSEPNSPDENSCNGLSFLCPAVDAEYPIYIPLTNCGAFCQCSNGEAYYHSCPAGFYFNPTLNVCDNPADAGCTGVSETTSTTQKPE